MSILQRARAWLRDHGVSLSSQNLNEKPGTRDRERYGSMLAHGRAWFRRLTADGDDYRPGTVRVEWALGPRAGWGAAAEVVIDPDDREVTLALGVPGANVYLSLDGLPARLFQLLPMNAHRPERQYPSERKLGVRLHSGAAWFSLWGDRMEWRSRDPWWMDFRIGLDDIATVLFGPETYAREVLEVQEVLIPMPEGLHEAVAQLDRATWTRPRFPWWPVSKERYGVTIDTPGGIETDHKGPLYAMSMQAPSVAGAVGELVGSVYRSRGGFERPPVAPAPGSPPTPKAERWDPTKAAPIVEGVRPTLAQVIDGEEWAKHNFSRVPMCCAIGCGKPATWGAIADNAPPTPDNIGETHACDDHLVEIGLTTYVDHPEAKHWRVWAIGEGPFDTASSPPSTGSGGYELVELAPAPVPVA